MRKNKKVSVNTINKEYLTVICKNLNIDTLTLDSPEVESIKFIITDYYNPNYNCIQVNISYIIINGKKIALGIIDDEDEEEDFDEIKDVYWDFFEEDEKYTTSRDVSTVPNEHFSQSVLKNHKIIITEDASNDD